MTHGNASGMINEYFTWVHLDRTTDRPPHPGPLPLGGGEGGSQPWNVGRLESWSKVGAFGEHHHCPPPPPPPPPPAGGGEQIPLPPSHPTPFFFSPTRH